MTGNNIDWWGWLTMGKWRLKGACYRESELGGKRQRQGGNPGQNYWRYRQGADWSVGEALCRGEKVRHAQARIIRYEAGVKAKQ